METQTSINTDKLRIYVASLADYNAGRLLGRWINAAQEADAIHAEIKAMLAESREMVAEEWAIHDYEGFGTLKLGEYESIENVAELANLIQEHGEVFAGLVDHFGDASDLSEAKRYMEDGYRGEFAKIEDYVEQFIEDCYGDVLATLPSFLWYHIDYEGVARDMEIGGDIFTVECNSRLHVFEANV